MIINNKIQGEFVALTLTVKLLLTIDTKLKMMIFSPCCSVYKYEIVERLPQQIQSVTKES